MAHLNMIYSNMNNAKPLSIAMLKNHVGGLYLLTANNNRILFFLDSTIRLCCLFLLKTKCVYINCYYRSMLKE